MFSTTPPWLNRSEYSHIYIPLYPSRKEIRVIHLFSAKKHALTGDLRCTLDNVSLLEVRRPQYQAISYCWSELSGTAPININGVRLNAPASAVAALRRFQPPSGSVTLWIDALCINQTDHEERSQQVRLMGDIYRLAKCTLIWLGSPGQTDSKVPEAVDRALADMKKETRKWLVLKQTPTPTREHFQTLHALFARRWFQRLWVLQEAVLAPTATCFLGNHDFPWQDICDCAHWVESEPSQIGNANARRRPGYKTALVVRRFLSQKEVPLGELLVMSRQLEVSDSKDKIFAVLGLTTAGRGNWHSQLIVDYTQPLPAIYASATRVALLETGHLGLLREVEHVDRDRLAYTDYDSEHMFPSWTPRYDRNPTAALNADVLPTLCAADGRRQVDLDLLSSKRYPLQVLPLRGIIVDHIQCVSPVVRYSNLLEAQTGRGVGLYPRMATFVLRHCACTANILQHLALEITSLGSVLRPGTNVNVNKEQIAHFVDYLGFVALHLYHGQNLSSALEQLRGREHIEGFSEHLNHANPLCTNRKVFVTDSGRVGLGPQTMTGQRAESVVILFGSRLPYVLRSQGVVSTPEGGYRPSMALRYQLVGHCSLQGIMNGEAVLDHEASGREALIFEIV